MSYEDEMERARAASARRESAGLPLFGEPQVRPLARREDPDTSKDAAMRIVGRLSQLQQDVLSAYVELGPMTAKRAEKLPRFEHLGYSTVRKRTGELWRRGLLRDTGRREDGCIVFGAVGSATTQEAA
jgi:hypothetical protein